MSSWVVAHKKLPWNCLLYVICIPLTWNYLRYLVSDVFTSPVFGRRYMPAMAEESFGQRQEDRGCHRLTLCRSPLSWIKIWNRAEQIQYGDCQALPVIKALIWNQELAKKVQYISDKRPKVAWTSKSYKPSESTRPWNQCSYYNGRTAKHQQ